MPMPMHTHAMLQQRGTKGGSGERGGSSMAGSCPWWRAAAATLRAGLQAGQRQGGGSAESYRRLTGSRPVARVARCHGSPPAPVAGQRRWQRACR